jgi:hypothetical protein
VAAVVAGTSAVVTNALQAPGSSVVAGHWDTKMGSNAATQVTAVFRYRGAPGGTRIEARVSGVKPGTTCQLWVKGADGKWQVIGSWTEGHAWNAASTWYPASSSVSMRGVHGFEITSGQQVLVSAPA